MTNIDTVQLDFAAQVARAVMAHMVGAEFVPWADLDEPAKKRWRGHVTDALTYAAADAAGPTPDPAATFGQALQDYCGRHLPFLVRVEMARTVKAVQAWWETAGAPITTDELRALGLPRRSADPAPPPLEAVERAARAIAEHYYHASWAELDDHNRDRLRSQGRIALEAAAQSAAEPTTGGSDA